MSHLNFMEFSMLVYLDIFCLGCFTEDKKKSFITKWQPVSEVLLP